MRARTQLSVTLHAHRLPCCSFSHRCLPLLMLYLLSVANCSHTFLSVMAQYCSKKKHDTLYIIHWVSSIVVFSYCCALKCDGSFVCMLYQHTVCACCTCILCVHAVLAYCTSILCACCTSILCACCTSILYQHTVCTWCTCILCLHVVPAYCVCMLYLRTVPAYCVRMLYLHTVPA